MRTESAVCSLYGDVLCLRWSGVLKQSIISTGPTINRRQTASVPTSRLTDNYCRHAVQDTNPMPHAPNAVRSWPHSVHALPKRWERAAPGSSAVRGSMDTHPAAPCGAAQLLHRDAMQELCQGIAARAPKSHRSSRDDHSTDLSARWRGPRPLSGSARATRATVALRATPWGERPPVFRSVESVVSSAVFGYTQ